MWIYVPKGFCPSAPELGDSSKASGWRSEMLALSAALNTKHTPATSWLRAWKKALWIQRLFGRIYDPLWAALGVVQWTESWGGTPVNPLVTPASASGPRTPGTSGHKSPVSSTKSSPAGASSKTSADISPSDSTLSGETFEAVVTALKQDYSVRKKWAQAIAARGSSSSQWPTARAEDSESAGNHPGATDSLTGAVGTWPTATKQDAESSGRHTTDPEKLMHPGTTLTDKVRQWQTPATDAFRCRGGDRKGEMGLDQQARMWATPRTVTGGGESADRKKELGRKNSGGGDLQAQVENWPTPRANDAEKNGNVSRDKRNGLVGKVVVWPTPASRDAKGANSLLHCEEIGTGRKHMDQLPNFVAHSPSSPQVRVTSVSGIELSPTDRPTVLRRRLNPAFVCWLMGWPWWWTNPVHNSSGQQATASYLFKLRMHLASLLARWESFSRR